MSVENANLMAFWIAAYFMPVSILSVAISLLAFRLLEAQKRIAELEKFLLRAAESGSVLSRKTKGGNAEIQFTENQ